MGTALYKLVSYICAYGCDLGRKTWTELLNYLHVSQLWGHKEEIKHIPGSSCGAATPCIVIICLLRLSILPREPLQGLPSWSCSKAVPNECLHPNGEALQGLPSGGHCNSPP